MEEERLFDIPALTKRERTMIMGTVGTSCRRFCLAIHRLGRVRNGKRYSYPDEMIAVLRMLLTAKGGCNIDFLPTSNGIQLAARVILVAYNKQLYRQENHVEDFVFVDRYGFEESIEEELWGVQNPLPPTLHSVACQDPNQDVLLLGVRQLEPEELVASA